MIKSEFIHDDTERKIIIVYISLNRITFRYCFALLVTICGLWSQSWAQSESRRIAVLDFKNEAQLSSFEISSLTGIVRSSASQLSGYIVMTTENIRTLLPPDKAPEDCIGSCEVETGQMLGAAFIVTGEVGRVEGLLQLSMRIFNTTQGKLLDQQVLQSETVLGLQQKLGLAAQTLLQRVSSVTVANDSVSGGTIYLTFSPSNIQLEINDDPLPRSNLKAKGEGYLLKLKPGKYTLGGKAQGYMTQRETFVLSEGSVLELTLNLNKALKTDRSCDPKDKNCRGQIQVFTQPAGSRLWVDSIQTPYISQPSRRDPKKGTYTLSLTPGEHIIEARLNRYISAKTKVTIVRDDINLDLKQSPLILQPNFGDLQISSTPSGATVFLDDKLVGQTPYKGNKIDAGPHKVRLFLEGYHTESNITVVKRKTINRESFTLKPTFSTMSVVVSAEGKPLQGATVLLDQKIIGKTSGSGTLDLGRVEAGERQLQVSHSLHEAYIQPITVTEGKQEQLKVTLKPAYAFITVRVKEAVEATVKLDGETLGRAPISNLKIATGNSVLEVIPVKAGLYERYKSKLALSTKEQKVILADCRAMVGTLTIMTNPPEADLYVDGQLKGQSPLKLTLAQGQHMVEARYPNYSSNKTEVMIKDDETQVTRLKLSRDPIIEMSCSPSGNLYVDDTLIGSSPQEVNRKPGTYTVRCENGGLNDTKRVTLSNGRVKVSLKLLSKALKAQSQLRKTKLNRAGWVGLSALLMAGATAGSWITYQTRLDQRDEKLNALDTAAWQLDKEAHTLNQLSLGLGVTTALLSAWSIYDLFTRPPEPKLSGQAVFSDRPSSFKVKFNLHGLKGEF